MEDRYQQVEEIRENNVKELTILTMDISLIKSKIEEIAESLTVEPVDADIAFYPNEKDKFKLFPEQDGLKVDADELNKSVEQIFIAEKAGEIAIEPIAIEPEVRLADLEKATSKIVTFSTSMSGSSQNRMSNIALSFQKINGTKLNPGETFSFNEVVGPRTAKTGFKPAPVITADKSLQDGIGHLPGLSTLFNGSGRS